MGWSVNGDSAYFSESACWWICTTATWRARNGVVACSGPSATADVGRDRDRWIFCLGEEGLPKPHCRSRNIWIYIDSDFAALAWITCKVSSADTGSTLFLFA